MPLKARVVLGSKKRYKVLYGGRGKGASYSIADNLVTESAYEPLRNLCTREIQNSIKDSVHRLLSDRIYALGLEDVYEITEKEIRSKCGSLFIFKGLRSNTREIKSTEGIDRCWVAEAEGVSENSWDILTPTIRKENSQIIVDFNPEDEKSATYQKFIVNTPPDCIAAYMTYRDNEMFPEVLRRDMEYCKRIDYEKYLHVWEGQIKRYSEACIFHNKIHVEEFETPEDSRFYFGADWGFSNDPVVLGRMFIKDNCLYIDHEFYAVGVEITELERAFDTVPGSRKWRITADSERPDTISFLARKGFNITGAEKGKGSVEDGIEFLRSFEKIIIHPRCRGAIDNFSNYRWKQDKITQEILPIPADGSDHWPDSARYALEQYVRHKTPGIRWL